MSFLGDSAKMIGWRGISILLGAANAILLARWLGPADRGTLAVYLLSVGLGAVVLQLGIPEALIYLVGTRTYPLRDVVATALAYCAVVGCVVGLAAFVTMAGWFALTPTMAALLATAVGLTMVLSTVRHVLLGQKRFVAYSLSTVFEVGTYLLVATTLWIQDSLTLQTVVGAYLLSVVISAVVAVALLRASGALSLSRRHLQLPILTACVRRGFHLFLVGLGGFGVQRINYFALEAVAGSKSVGLFTAANTLPRLVANLPQQLAITLYSHVSNRDSGDRGVEATTAITSSLAAFFALILVPLWYLAESFVQLLFGQEFAGIGDVMVILTASMMLSGLGSLLFNALAGLGEHSYGSKLTLLNLSVLIVLAAALIPAYGLPGAAWAQLLTNFVNLAYMVAVFCRSSQIRPWSLFVVSPSALRRLVREIPKEQPASSGAE